MRIAGYLRGNLVFNIQNAVSRLGYAPKLNDILLTDIKKGLGIFTHRL